MLPLGRLIYRPLLLQQQSKRLCSSINRKSSSVAEQQQLGATSEVGIINSPFPDVKLSELPYYDYVFEHAERHRQRTAVVNGISGESWDFGQLQQESRLFFPPRIIEM